MRNDVQQPPGSSYHQGPTVITPATFATDLD